MNTVSVEKRARRARNQRNYRERLRADHELECRAHDIIWSIVGCPAPAKPRNRRDPAWWGFHLSLQITEAIENAARVFYELDPAEGERFGKWLCQRVSDDFMGFMEQMNQWFHAAIQESGLCETDMDIITEFRAHLPRIRRAADARIRDGILPPLLERRLAA